MKNLLRIISVIPVLLLAEACTSYTSQKVGAPCECDSKSAITFSQDGGHDAKDGFSVVGISSDGGDIVINDIALQESSPELFATAGRHNIPYGLSIDFYALYPKEFNIGIADGNVSFTYGPEHKGTDILAGEAEAFIYSGNSAGNTVPIRFHHIMGGLEISVQGIDEEAEYIVKSLSAKSAASAIYNFRTSRWDKMEGYDDTALDSSGGRQYLIPGNVEISVRWSCTHNGIETAEYTATVPVILTMGRVSRVKLSLSDSGSEKTGFDVIVEPWDQSSVESDFPSI